MSWKFGESPEPYELRFRNAKYALVLVMGGDCDLGVHLDGDFAEMTRAVGPDVAALVLVDYPEPEEDEFYHADLLGLEVVQEGAKIGTVKAIIPAGAGDVLEIDRGPGQETLLVPFTKAAVPEINIGAGRLTVDPPRDADI